MSKLYFFIAFAFTGIVTSAQTITIPDPNFKAKLIASGIDTNTDGEIQQSEALSVTGLFLDSANINSLEGIQSFSNVTLLYCSYNPLTEINLCGTAVSFLVCSYNPNLTTINLKNNVISETIWTEPPLAPFIVEHLPALQYVCADAGEMGEAYAFTLATANTITFTSDCNTTNCPSLLNSSSQVQDLAFSIYPNPATSMLNVTLNAEIKSVSIYNTLGQMVQEDLSANKSIDVSDLQTGIYFLKIVSDKGVASTKFIKK